MVTGGTKQPIKGLAAACLATLIFTGLPSAGIRAQPSPSDTRVDVYPGPGPTDECAQHQPAFPVSARLTPDGIVVHTEMIKAIHRLWLVDRGPVLVAGLLSPSELASRSPDPSARTNFVAAKLMEAGIPAAMVYTAAVTDAHVIPIENKDQVQTVLVRLSKRGEQCASNLRRRRGEWVARNCFMSLTDVEQRMRCGEMVNLLSR